MGEQSRTELRGVHAHHQRGPAGVLEGMAETLAQAVSSLLHHLEALWQPWAWLSVEGEYTPPRRRSRDRGQGVAQRRLGEQSPPARGCTADRGGSWSGPAQATWR